MFHCSTLLLVDHDPANLAALEGLLRAPEYHLVTAADGPEALTKAAALRPDLILLGGKLSGLDGFEVCRRLRADPQLAEVPVVLVDASDDPDSLRRGLDAGADDVLTRPLNSAVLRARVQTLTRLSRGRRLAGEQARLAPLIERSPDGILVADGAGLIRLVNPALCQMASVAEPATVQGRPLKELLCPAAKDTCLLHLQAAVADPRHHAFFETQLLGKDQRKVPVEVYVGHVPWEGRPAAQFLVRDLTKRKGLEEQVRQAQKLEAMGQLAGGLAHDFNNLLTVISGYSEVLLDHLKKGAPGRSEIEEISKAAARAGGLAGQLLAFSRKHPIKLAVLNVNAVLTDLERLMRRVLREDIQLVLALSPAPLRVKADRTQVEQVVLNLLINARDALPQGGRITLTAQAVRLGTEAFPHAAEFTPGEYVCLKVEDTGCGMDEATRARLFEPFFTTKPAGTGTGLGLATVHGIVHQGKGQIRVRSQPGRGSTFEIFLPATTEEMSPQGPEAAATPPAPAEWTILLAEDEDSVRKLAEFVLTDLGYRVLTAENGMDALQQAQEHPGPIHLLVTDARMPGMHGFELATRLTALRPGLPVLLMSGYADAESGGGEAPRPEWVYLQKPFSVVVLAQKVQELLASRP